MAATPPYTAVEAEQYRKLFRSMVANGLDRATRQQVSMTMGRANLPQGDVDVIWALCDLDADGYLDEEEVLLALHLAASRYKGSELPTSLPRSWLSASKHALVAEDSFSGGGGDADGDAASSLGGSDDFQVQSKQKRGSILSWRSGPKEPKPKKGDKHGASDPGGASSWPPADQNGMPGAAGSGFGGGFGGGGGGGGGGFSGGGGGGDQLPNSSFQFGDPTQKISISFGQTKQVTQIEDRPLVEPNSVSRSGSLTTTAGGKQKLRWVVLGAGQLAVYSDKKDAASAKPPKCTVDMRADVSRVVCNSMSSFSITLAREVKDAKDKAGKAKALHKAGESLTFAMDDSKELTAWVNDLTNVWRALQVGR